MDLTITKEKLKAASMFRNIYEDSKRLEECVALQAEEVEREKIYNGAVSVLDSRHSSGQVEVAIGKLKGIEEWKDSKEKIVELQAHLEELKKQEAEEAKIMEAPAFMNKEEQGVVFALIAVVAVIIIACLVSLLH